MPSPSAASDLAERFIRRLKALEASRSQVESLCARSLVNRATIEQWYAGLFISTINAFEELIESLFVGLLAGRFRARRDVHPRVTLKRPSEARQVLLGTKEYVDWFPYENTEKMARAYFRGGRPFTRLDGDAKAWLRRMLTIRNALAHHSAHAATTFQRRVIGSIPLLPSEKRPAAFLRSVFRTAPAQTRYEQFATEFADLARKLCG